MRRPLAPLACALLLLLPLASAAWTTEGGDARRAGTVTAAIPTSNVALVWNASGQYPGALVLPDGAVVGWGDPVAVWEKDGTQRWSTRTVGPQNQVFVARGAALLSNGTIVAAGSLPFGAPAIVGYDPKDGKQIIFDRNFTQGQKCDSLDDSGIAVAADDSFYVGCGPGVVAFHKDGTRKWSYTGEVERVVLSGANVVAEAEDVKLANGTTYEDALIALSQSDGSLVWATRLDDGGGDPIVAADGTIVVADAGTIRAFSGTDGAPKWRTMVPRPYGLAIAPNGTIASGSSNGISWLAPADGTTIGASRTVDGTGLLVGANVHLRIYGANVVAVDTQGQTLWQVNGTARNYQIKPAIADDGTLYLPEEGQMRAYRGSGGTTAPTSPSTTAPPASTPQEPTAGGEKGAPGPGLALVLGAVAAVVLALRRRG